MSHQTFPPVVSQRHSASCTRGPEMPSLARRRSCGAPVEALMASLAFRGARVRLSPKGWEAWRGSGTRASDDGRATSTSTIVMSRRPVARGAVAVAVVALGLPGTASAGTLTRELAGVVVYTAAAGETNARGSRSSCVRAQAVTVSLRPDHPFLVGRHDLAMGPHHAVLRIDSDQRCVDAASAPEKPHGNEGDRHDRAPR